MAQVSVIIPLYNKALHIERALRSVLDQSFQDFEVVVVDDGSTDNSATVVSGIHDPRIRLIRQANGGVSAARNRGVEESSSPLVAFLDADDDWHPTFLATVMDLRRRFPHAGAYGTGYAMYQSPHVRYPHTFADVPTAPQGGIIQNYFKAALTWEPLSSSSVMIPKMILKEVGGFPVGVRLGEDIYVWMRIAMQYPVAWSPNIAAYHHLDAVNRSGGRLYIGNIPMPESIISDFWHGNAAQNVKDSFREVVVRWRLKIIKTNWLAGERLVVSSILRQIRDTRMYRKQYIRWKIMNYIPYSCVLAAWKLYQRLHGRQPVLPPRVPLAGEIPVTQ